MHYREKRDYKPYLVRYDATLQDISSIFVQEGTEFVLVCDENEQIIGRIFPYNIDAAIDDGLGLTAQAEQLMPSDLLFVEFSQKLQSLLGSSLLNSSGSTVANNTVKHDHWQLIWQLCQLWQNNMSELEVCFNSIYNPVITVDDCGKIRLYNRALEKVSGISAAEARGEKITDVFSNSRLLEVLSTGQTQATRKIQYRDKLLLTNRTPLYQ